MHARSLLLLALCASLPLACRRLNPEWCASGTRCAPGEVCDPATNSCVRLEGGVRIEARPVDGPAAERLLDAPRDRAPIDRRLQDTRVESCSLSTNGWVCAGGAAYECTEAATIKRRVCPQGRCEHGHCELPSSTSGCKRNQDCSFGRICTVLLDAGQPKQLCASPVIGLPAPAVCTTGLDCASGLCTSSGQCYYPCDVGFDCPPSYTCKAITVDVEGVSASLESCELP